MAEISNNLLAVLVVAALVVVVAGTVLNIVGLDALGLTGFATTDTGNVSLTINSTLAIQVDPNNATVSFGTCNPAPASAYTCATNDSVACNGVSAFNCSGDTGQTQFIGLTNVGNVDANITVAYAGACTATQLIGGTNPDIKYTTSGCNGTGITTWTTFNSSSNACNNLSFRGPGLLKLYVNVTVPNNAAPTSTCTSNRTTVQFTAALA